jgi:type I restriction enzyme S subunit
VTERVGKVLRLERRRVEVQPDREYTEIGIRSFGRGVFHKEPTTSFELGNKRVFFIEPGDLVISNVFAWEGAIAMASDSEAGTIGSHRFMTFVPVDDDQIDIAWTMWFFRSEPGLELIRQASPGSAGRNRTLAIDRFEALEIPLPPIDEQRRVARRLDAAQSLLSDVEGRTAVRAAVVRALFDQIVRETIDGLNARERPLGNDIEIVSGATPDSGNPLYWDGNVTWITPTDLGGLSSRDITSSSRALTDAGYESCSALMVQPGAVVMSSRAPIGHLGIARVPLCTNQGCKTFLPPDDVLPEYLYYALKARLTVIREAGTGTTFQEVSKAKLRALAVPIPDDSTQERVVATLDSIWIQHRKLLDATSRSDQVRAAILPALQNDAFSLA